MHQKAGGREAEMRRVSRKSLNYKGILLISLLLPLLASTHAVSGTLDSVRSRGMLRCGVNEGLPGFSMSDSNGEWSGIDVDLYSAHRQGSIPGAA